MMKLEEVNNATLACMRQGIRVLNAFLLADDEAAHAAKLLELMRPPTGAVVLDAGCGIGEVARLMRAHRPDLQFKLLNISEQQLALCPPDCERILASYDDIPLADNAVDVVMLNYALCHSNHWLTVMQEAQRVLKEGGILFINDMSRDQQHQPAADALMQHCLQARPQYAGDVVDQARQAGFAFDEGYFHTPVVQRLRQAMANDGLYQAMFAGVEAATWRFIKHSIADPIASAFARHQKIAFQFSGGRDSTAALYLLRPYWHQMQVYHLDTGDQFPETIAVVKQVEQDFGPLIKIKSDVHAIRQEFGLATDLLPVDNTGVGQRVSGRQTRLQSRYDCCVRSLMLPMHQRIVADGNTLIIRGQRDDEYAQPPLRSGDSEGGLEVLYPIQHWTGEQVSAYLRKNDLPLAAFYERGARRAPECMGCTAWWDEGRAAYLRDYHPAAYQQYTDNMKIIRIEIDRQYQMLEE